MFNRLRMFALNMHCTALVIAILMLVALFVGGAQPEAAGLIPAPWDKLAHVVYFLVFTFLLLRFAGFPLAVVVVLALLVGAADEMHQSFLPGRVAGWEDWLADALGIGLGLIMHKVWRVAGQASV